MHNTYQSPRIFTKWANYALYAWSITTIVMLAVQFFYTNSELVWAAPGWVSALVLNVFPVLKFCLFLAGAILLMLWVHRNQQNLELMKIKGLSHSPELSAAWFVIPVANIVMPFQVLRNQFMQSDPMTDLPGNKMTWHYSEAPAILYPLWFGVIVVAIFSNPWGQEWIFPKLGYLGFYYFLLVLYICQLLLGVFLLKLMEGNDDRMAKKWEKLKDEIAPEGQVFDEVPEDDPFA